MSIEKGNCSLKNRWENKQSEIGSMIQELPVHLALQNLVPLR